MRSNEIRNLALKMLIIEALFICSSVAMFGQVTSEFSHKVDSLKSALVGTTGRVRYEILDKLAYEYVTIVDSFALIYAKEAFNMSWQFGDSAGTVKTGRYMSMAFTSLSKFDSTIKMASALLPIARRNNYVSELKHLLNLLAIAHLHKAEFDKALAYNFESLELRKKHENDFSISIALNNIGLVYFKIDNLEEASKYFAQALELRSLNGEPHPDIDISYYLNSLANLAHCYAFSNKPEKAKGYLDKAYKHCREGCSDATLTILHFASGLVQFRSDNLEPASTMFLQSLSIARKAKDRRFELENLIALSKIFVLSNRISLAEEYLLQAEPLFESDIPFRVELAEVYEQLSKVYMLAGDHARAFVYQSRYIELSKKIYDRQITSNLMAVQAEYLERESKAKIAAQEKILALNNAIISRQRYLNIVVGIISILSIALVIALVQNVRQKKRVNRLLEQKVRERTLELEINHSELLKSLEERNRQMRRISSEIKSSMATIKGLCKLTTQDESVVNAGQYIDKIEEASDNLQSGIYRALGIADNAAV